MSKDLHGALMTAQYAYPGLTDGQLLVQALVASQPGLTPADTGALLLTMSNADVAVAVYRYAKWGAKCPAAQTGRS